MRTILKYVIHTYRLFYDMPEGAIILSAKAQGEDICVWAEVDTSRPLFPRKIIIIATGLPLPPNEQIRFIDTVVLEKGNLIFHLYEGIET